MCSFCSSGSCSSSNFILQKKAQLLRSMEPLHHDFVDVTLAQSDASPVCKHFQTGFCKFAENCKWRHEKEICQITRCSSKACRKRHPKLCKFFALNNFCKFEDLCCYKHIIAEPHNTPHLLTTLQTKVDAMEQMIETLQSEIVALKNTYKCEVCDHRASSSTTLKPHISKKHKHASQHTQLENERNQLSDTSLNASLPCEERHEFSDSAFDNIEDDPMGCDWCYCPYLATSSDDMAAHIQIAHTITSSFVYPKSSETILCPCDECEEEFFLDHTFAMHVFNVHKFAFKCEHCEEYIPGCEELEEIHMKMCSSSCTDTHCSTGNPKYTCPF